MHLTIFSTPVLKQIFRAISLVVIRMLGWKYEGKKPAIKKYVMIAAPHTSNWDALYAVLISFSLGLEIHWLGKNTLFKWPFGWLIKWCGGIPVYRSRSNNLISETVNNFNNNENLVLLITPEGTRQKVNHWKTGFYHIALGAGVPVLLSYLDYGKKTGGLGPMFYPTGDIEIDLVSIKTFYQNIKGRNGDGYNRNIDIAEYKKNRQQVS